MKKEYFFNNAKWVGIADATPETFTILRGCFDAEDAKKVTLNVIGLGFFKCYINGKCINPDTFLPLSSEYETGCDPKDEVLSGRRIYVPQFDITPFVQPRDNTIDIHFGGGWYTLPFRVFGTPKAIYSVAVETDNDTKYYDSDENCLVAESFVTDYHFLRLEEHNYLKQSPCFSSGTIWKKAVLAKPLETEYCATDCPADALIATLSPKKVGKGEKGIVYDCGENTCGYVVVDINAKSGDRVNITFAEEITNDGRLDPSYIHGQHFTVISNGEKCEAQPEFIWFGFRYFEVEGDAEVKCVKVVHTDISVNSTFECDNETLNWIYKTFVHTMLCNMHIGHPSDCPHLERRGYTGDGQVTCHAVLSTLDAKSFYEKWMQDIADCQDSISGHIQYTAPYVRSGGGPGGWGCSVVEVAYQLYKHYGDKGVLEKYYPNMCKYIEYLESHSEFGLVTKDKEGEWCLGDWCLPVILYPDKNISSNNRNKQQVFLPAPFVNTYFMVKSLNQMAEIAEILGKTEEANEHRAKAEERKRAITSSYFNAYDSSFIFNLNAANAFAVDIGLGNERTYAALVDFYDKLGSLDTGIFGTDILIRVLFERGDGELAVKLLTGDGKYGFERWRKSGATTLHEDWDSLNSRSHNHPMFGAPVAYFFEYLLGIKQKESTIAYSSLVIEPQATSMFNRMSGSMTISNGIVSVSYVKA